MALDLQFRPMQYRTLDYASNMVHWYAKLAVSSPAAAESLPVPKQLPIRWVGLGGWFKYQDDIPWNGHPSQ